MKSKLNRYKKELTEKTDSSPSQNEGKQNRNEHNDTKQNLDFWEKIQGSIVTIGDSSCIVRQVEYPIHYKHGLYELSKFHDVVARWQKSPFAHPLSSAGVHPSDIIFFDTETTGLGSGAGHMIFMIGTATVEKDKVVIKQYFLTGPGSEVAFYKKFLSDVTNLQSLVTYNGKSFDWPKLKARHTMLKKELPSLPSFAHYDLLHAARRLWKNKLDNVKLGTIESEILTITRTDDTPGYLAPIFYFDYLKSGELTQLKGVFEHNEIDVLSLITLYIHMSELLLAELETDESDELIELAKWFEQKGDREQAMLRYKQIISVDHPRKLEAIRALGFLYKKSGDYEKASFYFLEFISKSQYFDTTIGIELAKIYEHKLKKLDQALHYSLLSFKEWKRQKKIFKAKKKCEEEMFMHRIERLKRKLK